MSKETAKLSIDYILDTEISDFKSVVFNFIGGEPFLEIDLIDWMCDYLKMQMYMRDHHWFNSYRISITTNGINYDSQKVQRFIQKNKKHLSITITIDGTQKKHDINRIWKQTTDNDQKERGSYDSVVKNIPLWLEQFPNAATKVTISSPDIPYVCESVLHLFSLGIHNVHINCVFENVWTEGDDILFEEQLTQLANKMVDDELYKNYDCSLFDRNIGYPLDSKNDRNWCGAGLMLAIDSAGNLYPCTRFAKYALREKPPRIIGNVKDGINNNLLRPYYCLSRTLQSKTECIECEVASGCAWCQGENYDSSDSQTIFQRSTAICKMHKARVKANRYYWSRLDERTNKNNSSVKHLIPDNKCTLDKTIDQPEKIIVLLSSLSTPFCLSNNLNKENILLPLEILQKLTDMALKNGWHLLFVYPDFPLPEKYVSTIDKIPHKKIVPYNPTIEGDAVVFCDWGNICDAKLDKTFIIVRTTLADFYQNLFLLKDVLNYVSRINFVFTDEQYFSPKDETLYRDSLKELTNFVIENWNHSNDVEVNILTDRLHLSEMDGCNAGWKNVTLAPNGKFYICPDYYYNDPEDICGNIDDGLDVKNPLLYKLNHFPLCSKCGAFHCQRCVFLNRMKTLEVNIPSYEQCKKTEIEIEATKSLYHLWKSKESF